MSCPSKDKAVLRFLLSGNTSFWSRPEVAYRMGFGTAPWRCINRCQGQYYDSMDECAPDCVTQTYCEPGGGFAVGEGTVIARIRVECR